VLHARGQWQRPLALGILDDHSRLCCHLQWYLSETAEDLVHGLSQAIQKRGLPRALMTDNGAAMIAEEVSEGLLAAGDRPRNDAALQPLPERQAGGFLGDLEGRLMEMLEGVSELTLDFLNRPRRPGSKWSTTGASTARLGCSPVERFARAPDVLRASPSSRRSAGSVSQANHAAPAP
jgi:putative transposase